jgi:hypothetical protein
LDGTSQNEITETTGITENITGAQIKGLRFDKNK